MATKLIKSKASDACQDGMSDVRVDIVVGVVEFHVNSSNNKCLSTGHVARLSNKRVLSSTKRDKKQHFTLSFVNRHMMDELSHSSKKRERERLTASPKVLLF